MASLFETIQAGGIAKKPNLFDRAANDLGNIASGFVPGMFEIGKTLGHDFKAAVTGGDYHTDNLGGAMWKGFKEQSFIAPLAGGNFGEAAHRFSDRPVSGLLDASLIFPAAGAATTLGSRVGTVGSRTAFAELGGFKALHPESRLQIEDAMTRIADPEVPGGFEDHLPATIQFADGTSAPAREYLMDIHMQNIGDNVMLRQTQRTINPTPELVQGDKSGMYEGWKGSVQSPEGKLIDDEYRNLTTPRADNELIAKVGDVATAGLQKLDPTDKFGLIGNARAARKMGLMNTQSLHRDQDEMAAFVGQVYDDLKRKRDELRPDLSDEQLMQHLGTYVTMVRHGVDPSESMVEDLTQAIDRFSPVGAAGPVDLGRVESADLDLRPEDFTLKTGLKWSRSRDAEGNLLDESAEPFHSFHSAREFWDRGLENKSVTRSNTLDGEYDSSYQLRTISPAERHLLERKVQSKEEVANLLDELVARVASTGGAFKVHIKDRNNLTHEVTPEKIAQWKSPDGQPAFYRAFMASHPDFRSEMGDLIPEVHHDADGLNLFAKSQAARENDIASGIAPDPEAGSLAYAPLFEKYGSEINALMDAVAEQLGNYNRYNSMHHTVSRQTGATVRTGSLNSGKPHLQENMIPQVPGIVDKLQSWIQDPQFVELAQSGFLDDAAQGLLKVTEKSGERAKTAHQGALDERKFKDDIYRQTRFLFGEDTQREGAFMKMQHEPGSKREGERVDAGRHLHNEMMEGNAGDPFEVFVNGSFRTDPNLHIDDFKDNSQKAKLTELIQHIHGIGKALTPEELRVMEKHGEITRESTLHEGHSRKVTTRAFVLLEPQGLLMKRYYEMLQGLNEMAASGVDEVAKLAQDLRPAVESMAEDDAALHGIKARVTNPAAAPLEMRAVPSPIYNALLRELTESHGALQWLKKAGNSWKPWVLQGRFPSFFRNNLVGSHIMLAMHGGIKEYGPALARTSKTLNPSRNELLYKHFPQLAENNSAVMAHVAAQGLFANKGGYFDAVRSVLNKMGDVNSKYADQPARLARLDQIIQERVAKLQDVWDHFGIKVDVDDPEFVDKLLADPMLNKQVSDEMFGDMVDFTDLNRFERDVVQSFLPFYAWTKGSAKSMMRLAVDHPERVWVMGQVADLGTNEAVADFGQAIPDFSKSLVDVGLPGDNLLNTSGWNPFSTPIELAIAAGQLIPGGQSYRGYGTENISSQLNPFLTAGIGAVSGRNLYFGTPVQNESIGTTFVKQAFGGLPPIKFVQNMIQNEQGPDSTSTRSRGLTALNMAGVPLQDPRWSAMYSRGRDEAQERYGNPGTMQLLNPRYPSVSPR